MKSSPDVFQFKIQDPKYPSIAFFIEAGVGGYISEGVRVEVRVVINDKQLEYYFITGAEAVQLLDSLGVKVELKLKDDQEGEEEQEAKEETENLTLKEV